MTLPATLPPPVAVSEIRSRSDRFRCEPYRVTLLVIGCVQRQAIVRSGKNTLEWSNCVKCPLGQEVEKNSGGPVDMKNPLDSLGRPRGGWHRHEVEGGMPSGRFQTRRVAPTQIGGPPAKCKEPGCEHMRGKYTSIIPGASDYCQSHRRKIGFALGRAKKAANGAPTSIGDLSNDSQEMITNIAIIRHAIGAEPAESQRKTEPAPAPVEEKPTMPKCTHPSGCNITLRPGKRRAPVPPGTETLCQLHREEYLSATTPPKPTHPGPRKPVAQKREVRRARSARWHQNRAKLAEAGARVLRPAPRIDVDENTSAALNRALEAVKLLDDVGWDVVRALASRIKEAGQER